MRICLLKNCKKVEYLLANGAHPNDQANCQASALHYAAECGNLEICKILLDNGALISVKNEYGMTPVITAAERTKEYVVEMFCEREKLLTKDEVNMMIILTILKYKYIIILNKTHLEQNSWKITFKI